MAQLFGHEKLQVYQKGIAFAEMRKGLLQGLPRRVAACEHFHALLNAHLHGTLTPSA